MRVLIISDIHANLAALEAVLAQAEAHDAVWCLGDLVGYGPDPNECVERIQMLPRLVCLAGNHDKAVLGEIPAEAFNDEAQAAILWTRAVLKPASLEYLRSLPARVDLEAFTLAHASPRQPVWEYILNRQTACENFRHFDTPYCLVGHTHIPIIFAEGSPCGERTPDYNSPTALSTTRLIINPGGVGQPRDQNPQPAYALLDHEARVWHYKRAAYDPRVTQRKMLDLSFPERLILRLAHGW